MKVEWESRFGRKRKWISIWTGCPKKVTGAELHYEADAMKRKVGQGRGKAASLDGWSGTHLTNLPLAFFQRLEEVIVGPHGFAVDGMADGRVVTGANQHPRGA